MATEFQKIEVRPMTGALGAEIAGVDLGAPLDNETFSEIYQAFLDHLVIFFRKQVITPEQHLAFARRFGPLHIHPFTVPMEGYPEIIEIIKEPDELHNWGDSWHTDLTFLEKPPLGSVLYAKEVPPFAGDTQWSNMYLAYQTLSDTMKSFIDGLACIHRGETGDGYANFKSMKIMAPKAQESEHPLVRTHPETGRKCLMVHRKFIKRIKGMTEGESRAILDLLHTHAENPDYAVRFRWEEGSIAMWDNRCTQHRVTADYFYKERGFAAHRRRMHRVTVEGDRPH